LAGGDPAVSLLHHATAGANFGILAGGKGGEGKKTIISDSRKRGEVAGEFWENLEL
jgi:hypothetical protein